MPSRAYWLAPQRLNLVAFLIATAAWICALVFAFRRPAEE